MRAEKGAQWLALLSQGEVPGPWECVLQSCKKTRGNSSRAAEELLARGPCTKVYTGHRELSTWCWREWAAIAATRGNGRVPSDESCPWVKGRVSPTRRRPPGPHQGGARELKPLTSLSSVLPKTPHWPNPAANQRPGVKRVGEGPAISKISLPGREAG